MPADNTIFIEPLSREVFAEFGDVLDASGEPTKLINKGKCGRFHDLASLEFSGQNARAGISLFLAESRSLPYTLDLVERHPLGSQSFLPMTQNPFLVIVSRDVNGQPERPQAFMTAPGQGINIYRNVWHGVLTPLHDPGLFAVIDRVGDGDNLEEYWFDTPFSVSFRY